MGGGSKQPATTTTIQKTELPAWLEDVTKQNIAIADQISKQPYQAYTGQTVADFSPETLQAFDYMKSKVGSTDPLFNSAASAAQAASTYTPLNIGASAVNAGSMSYDKVAAPGEVGFDAVNAPSFLTGDINAYMSPYISNVEEAALSRLQDAAKMGVNRIGDQARAAGAFGGSRQGISEGVALGEAARSAGELSANLRSQGFNTAANLMQADQQRALQAALANQAAGINTGQFNVQSALQAALANQAAGLTSGQANLDARMKAQLANQQANLQAALANQNAGLQSAGLNLSAANALGGLAGQQQQSYLTDASLLEGIGQAKQGMQQSLLDDAYARFLEEKNYPIDMLNLRLGATSATPYSQTTTGTTTRSGGSSGNSFLSGLGALGTGVGIAANLASIFSF